MLCPPHSPAPIVEDWLARHKHLVCFLMHMIGIPPTIVGVLLGPVYLALASLPIFLFSLGLFVGGYAIQFLGHVIEGTEPGEITAIRRMIQDRRRRGRAAPADLVSSDTSR
jgi:hypothetical protein